MNLSEKYVKLIIRPLEQESNRLKIKFCKNKFNFSRKKDKKHIEETDRLLLEYYIKFENFIKEDL